MNVGAHSSVFDLLEKLYVALRILVQSWEEEAQLVLLWLKMQDAFAFPSSTPAAVHRLNCLANNENNFFKLNRLATHLKAKHGILEDRFRCIVFVQQRITALLLSNWINTEPSLSMLRSGYVASRESRVTPTLKVSKQQVAETVEAFRNGRVNVLIATSVIEEGFDVPEANVVISYDHLKNSVELNQRFGRARAHDRLIVVLHEGGIDCWNSLSEHRDIKRL